MNEIEEALARIAEINLKDPTTLAPVEIDAIILHNRKLFAAYEGGVKPKKKESVKLTLADIGVVPKEKINIGRRKL